MSRHESYLVPNCIHAVLVLLLVLLSCGFTSGEDRFDLGLDEVIPSVRLHPPDVAPQLSPAHPSKILEVPIRLLPSTFKQPPSFPRRLQKDFVALVTTPMDWESADWQKLGLGVLAIGAVHLVDDEVRDWVNGDEQFAKITEYARPFGEREALYALGAALFIGHHYDQAGLEAFAKDGLEACILAAGVITPVLKELVGRSRPLHGHGSNYSGGLGSYDSFPSGEATSAFALASVIHGHTENPWLRATGWSLAGMAALHRLSHDAHWASDIAAGALIGVTVGNWVVKRNRPEFEGGMRTNIVPMVSEDHWGMTLAMRW